MFRHRLRREADFVDMSARLPYPIADYVPTLCTSDEIFRLRVVLSGFGLVWESAALDDRLALVAEEPEPFDPRWDAFLAAYVEHRCEQDGIGPPPWVYGDGRCLDEFWFAGGCFPFDCERTISTTPPAFRAHGIWIPAEELLVV